MYQNKKCLLNKEMAIIEKTMLFLDPSPFLYEEGRAGSKKRGRGK